MKETNPLYLSALSEKEQGRGICSCVRKITFVWIMPVNSGHFNFCALIFPNRSRVNTQRLLKMRNSFSF